MPYVWIKDHFVQTLLSGHTERRTDRSTWTTKAVRKALRQLTKSAPCRDSSADV